MRWLLVIILLVPCLAAAEETRPLADNPQIEARLKTLAVGAREESLSLQRGVL
jgi:hypothetical protein